MSFLIPPPTKKMRGEGNSFLNSRFDKLCINFSLFLPPPLKINCLDVLASIYLSLCTLRKPIKAHSREIKTERKTREKFCLVFKTYTQIGHGVISHFSKI